MSLHDAIDGGQPVNPERPETFIHPSQRKAFDPDVTVEEYIHYAKLTREQEDAEHKSGTAPKTGLLQQVMGKPAEAPKATRPSLDANQGEKGGHHNEPDGGTHEKRRGSIFSGFGVITNDEW